MSKFNVTTINASVKDTSYFKYGEFNSIINYTIYDNRLFFRVRDITAHIGVSRTTIRRMYDARYLCENEFIRINYGYNKFNYISLTGLFRVICQKKSKAAKFLLWLTTYVLPEIYPQVKEEVKAMNELSPMEEEWENFDPSDETTWTEDIVSYFKHVDELKREEKTERVGGLNGVMDDILKEIDEFTSKKGTN